jgi:mono/diheme cytochrome c family protein
VKKIAALLLSQICLLSAAVTATDSPKYAVDCPAGAVAAEKCTVDKNTYFGWRTYAANCQVCHGGSGMGSTFAPNLMDRLKTRVDYPRFLTVVSEGYTGQVGAMPAWKTKKDVMSNLDNLYRYLRARTDGKLPPGRPRKAP